MTNDEPAILVRLKRTMGSILVTTTRKAVIANITE